MNHYTFFKRAIQGMNDNALYELWESLSAGISVIQSWDDDIECLSKDDFESEFDNALDMIELCHAELEKRNYFEI